MIINQSKPQTVRVETSNLILVFICRTSITVFRHSNVSPWSRFRSDHSGVLLDFSFLMPLFVHHSLQYECGVKEIFASNKQTPFFIRQECGPRLASVFRHIGSYDTRDDTVFPTQGVFIRTTTELIGDRLSQYGAVKSDSHVEMNVPLFAGMSLQLCGRLGKIHENPRLMKPLPIDGLFFLGKISSYSLEIEITLRYCRRTAVVARIWWGWSHDSARWRAERNESVLGYRHSLVDATTIQSILRRLWWLVQNSLLLQLWQLWNILAW